MFRVYLLVCRCKRVKQGYIQAIKRKKGLLVIHRFISMVRCSGCICFKGKGKVKRKRKGKGVSAYYRLHRQVQVYMKLGCWVCHNTTVCGFHRSFICSFVGLGYNIPIRILFLIYFYAILYLYFSFFVCMLWFSQLCCGFLLWFRLSFI